MPSTIGMEAGGLDDRSRQQARWTPTLGRRAWSLLWPSACARPCCSRPSCSRSRARPACRPAVQARMKRRDAEGLAIRDAVVRGDLAAAKDRANVLLFLDIEGSPNDVWTQRLGAMDGAAAWLGSAPSPEAAAEALGPLGGDVRRLPR